MSIQRYTDPNIYEPELQKDAEGIWVLHDDHLKSMKEQEERMLRFALWVGSWDRLEIEHEIGKPFGLEEAFQFWLENVYGKEKK